MEQINRFACRKNDEKLINIEKQNYFESDLEILVNPSGNSE